MTYPSGPSRAQGAVTAGAGSQPEEVGRAVRMALLATLLGTAGVLALRRIAGALVAPLPPIALIGAGFVLALLAGTARSMARREPPGQGRAGGRGLHRRLLPTVSVLIGAAALSVPGSGWLGLTGLWSIVLAGEILVRRPVRLPPLRWPRLRSRWGARRGRTSRVDPPQRPAPHGTPEDGARPDAAPPEEVLQQLTRRQLADGAEELTGWLRVPFAADQRTENVHVAFCPPFTTAPHLSVVQSAGPPARVKTAQLLPYGVRLDLKLSSPAGAHATVLLEFAARAEAG